MNICAQFISFISLLTFIDICICKVYSPYLLNDLHTYLSMRVSSLFLIYWMTVVKTCEWAFLSSIEWPSYVQEYTNMHVYVLILLIHWMTFKHMCIHVYGLV